RQTMADTVNQVTLTSPTGESRPIDLQKVEPGLWRATTTANELGLWRATDGKLTALTNVGPANPREFAEVTSTTEVLSPLSNATGGDVRRVADATGVSGGAFSPVGTGPTGFPPIIGRSAPQGAREARKAAYSPVRQNRRPSRARVAASEPISSRRPMSPAKIGKTSMPRGHEK